jgi:hypothetical protein
MIATTELRTETTTIMKTRVTHIQYRIAGIRLFEISLWFLSFFMDDPENVRSASERQKNDAQNADSGTEDHKPKDHGKEYARYVDHYWCVLLAFHRDAIFA